MSIDGYDYKALVVRKDPRRQRRDQRLERL